MKTPHEVLIDYLSRQKLKMTPQRRVILDVFLAEEGHLTAEELYAKVKEVEPSVGQATVYRTLKLLAECGIAKEVDFNEGVARYELKHGTEHHDHLICEECRKTLEVVDERIEKLQEEVAAKYGFTLTSHKMYLYGICEDCRKKGR